MKISTQTERFPLLNKGILGKRFFLKMSKNVERENNDAMGASDKDIRADKNGLEIKIKQTQHQKENRIKPKRKSKKLCFVAEKLNMSVFLSRSGLKKQNK